MPYDEERASDFVTVLFVHLVIHSFNPVWDAIRSSALHKRCWKYGGKQNRHRAQGSEGQIDIKPIVP